MPHYFFDITGVLTHNDEEGVVLENPLSARVEALRLAGQLLADEPQSFLARSEWAITVSDERSRLFTLRMAADFARKHAPSAVERHLMGAAAAQRDAARAPTPTLREQRLKVVASWQRLAELARAAEKKHVED